MIPDDKRILSPLAAELARCIASAKGKRVPAAEIFDAAGRFDASLIGDPSARNRLREALGELQNAALITMPSANSRTGWDSRILPPLPVWIMRADPAPARRRVTPAARLWPSALETAGAIATRPGEYDILERIASWMRDHPDPVTAPVEERSLDLFDDEKALDDYLRTRLFTMGALTLETLACYRPPVPFASQYMTGSGPCRLLVVENLATYNSFLTVFRELSPRDRPELHLGWGVGGGFAQSVLSVPLLDPVPRQVLYFGDLDLAGLRIAANAARQARAAGLPELRPAASYYRFLLDGPVRWRKADASNRGAQPVDEEACCWLPDALRGPVTELLESRHRIPQERLGTESLRQHPSLLTELTNWLPG